MTETSKNGKKVFGTPWKPGQSGNPAGRKPLPAEVREAIKSNGEKAVARMNALLSDDEGWGKDGWIDQKVQTRLLEVAMTRAYGTQPAAPLDGGAMQAGALGQNVLRQVYDMIKAEDQHPEFINAKRADTAALEGVPDAQVEGEVGEG